MITNLLVNGVGAVSEYPDAHYPGHTYFYVDNNNHQIPIDDLPMDLYNTVMQRINDIPKQTDVTVNPVTGILQPTQNIISPVIPNITIEPVFAAAPKYGESGYKPSVAELQAGYQTESMNENELLQSAIQSSKEKAIYTPPTPSVNADITTEGAGASVHQVITPEQDSTLHNDTVTLADIPHAANMQQVIAEMPNIIIDTNNIVNNGNGETEDNMHELISVAPTLNVDDSSKVIVLPPEYIKAVTEAVKADPNANVSLLIDNAVAASKLLKVNNSSNTLTVSSGWFDKIVNYIYNTLYE